MTEIPIRVKLQTAESQQQFNLSSSESQQQFNLCPNTIIAGEKDYNRLINKPSINDIILQNNVTLQQLGLQNIYYNTKEYWNSQPSLVSKEGAIYIYGDYYTVTDEHGEEKIVPAIKIGDGTSYLIDMPIVNEDIADMLLNHVENTVIHVSLGEKAFWNNKLNVNDFSEVEEGALVFNRN